MTSRYAVVFERGPTSIGASVPDLPGCVAVGENLDEVTRLIQEAIEFHLEGMKLDGDPVPEPTTEVGYVEIDLDRVDANVAAEKQKS
jgi:predicted RNase H-like HicB family nuclease